MHKITFTSLVVILTLGALNARFAFAETISFFGGEIDYWGKAGSKEAAKEAEETRAPAPSVASSPLASQASKGENGRFEWSKHLDPKNTEFFKEGDYTPPEPFMELVRSPTDENIRMWFAYVDRKNELAERLAHRMQEYAQKNAVTLTHETKAQIVSAADRLPAPAESSRRFRFRMYFDSNCPHCKRMFGTLNELQSRGYFVEARQVDRGPAGHLRSEVPIVLATKEETSRFQIDAVPLLLVGDLEAKTVYRQTGFVTADELLRQVQAKPK